MKRTIALLGTILVLALAGGLIYGWLAWRTRSILWGTIAHVYILTLAVLAAGAAAGSAWQSGRAGP